MASAALNKAINVARLGAQKKQVWLVYQLNDDDLHIGTIWSNGTSEGEIYGLFSGAINAYMAPVLDKRVKELEDRFDSREALLELTAHTAIESLAGGPLSQADRDAQKKKILDRLNTEKFKLGKELKTERTKLPKSEPGKGIASSQKMGAQAKYIAEFFRDCCGDFDADGARHAEENFITQFSSIFGAVKPGPVIKVDLYMNFSPCLDQSSARTIADVAYSAGCMNKLKQLANTYNTIEWHVHYDAYFTAPTAAANEEACKLANAGTRNMHMYKLST